MEKGKAEQEENAKINNRFDEYMDRILLCKKRMQPKAAFLRGEFMKKFYLLSNEVMSGGTSFDEFSISRNCDHLVSEK